MTLSMASLLFHGLSQYGARLSAGQPRCRGTAEEGRCSLSILHPPLEGNWPIELNRSSLKRLQILDQIRDLLFRKSQTKVGIVVVDYIG